MPSQPPILRVGLCRSATAHNGNIQHQNNSIGGLPALWPGLQSSMHFASGGWILDQPLASLVPETRSSVRTKAMGGTALPHLKSLDVLSGSVGSGSARI